MVVLIVLRLDVKISVLFAHCVCLHILVKLR